MLAVVCWKWGGTFGPEYVNRMRSMLERHLRLPHELICVTNESDGIDERVRIVAPPAPLPGDLRCRRRMWQWSADRIDDFGAHRMLAIDLDVVLVDDITPLVARHEPIVAWRVGYAGVFSGSFLLANVGALDGAWRLYRDDPEGFPRRCGEARASDQAMLNAWLRGRKVAAWTEADGLVTWFGKGYERLERHGMGPGRPDLPAGARVVVLGSADKAVMDEGRYDWVRRHWR